MDTGQFYGRAKCIARLIPETSDDSELSSEGESDVEVVPTTSAVSDSIDDLSNEEEEEEEEPQPPVGRVGQRKFVWKTRQPNDVSSTEPAFEGEIFTGGDVKRPIEYFNDQFDNDMKKNIVEQSNLYAT
ncbi:hypothetical protein LSAT2_032998, partial [Lamellibrachia satsuma]